jgi:predicted porin
VRKLLICAVALGGFAASAQAADLSIDSLKDPLPDSLTYKGVTIYGTIDVGYAYQTAGRPVSSSFFPGLNWIANGNDRRSISTLTNNAASLSEVGVKVEEALGMGFVAIGKAGTAFNPISGEFADACKSLVQAANNPHPAASGAGPLCGQAFNTEVYAGLSNQAYGTLTIGRHASLTNEGIGTYDPNHGSFAFSFIGFEGSAVAGTGHPETALWDNSIKYTYKYGPVHASMLYSDGGDGTSLLGYGVGVNAGFTWKGLSIDGYYTRQNGSVAADGGLPVLGNVNRLYYTISNNEGYSVMGKYTFDLGGGFKDDAPSAKLTAFAGYVHMDRGNPDDTQASYAGHSTVGGYILDTPSANNTFVTDQVQQTAWVGATYETGRWAFTGAWYHQTQNSFTTLGGAQPGGDLDWVSGVVDYKFNKHFDVYGGVSWVDVTGAWANSQHETTNFATGLRLRF